MEDSPEDGQNDRLARRELFNYAPMVRAYMRGSFSDAALIDDLCQEVWLLVLKSDALPSNSSAVPSWLLAVCRTVRARELRRRKTIPAGLLFDIADSSEQLDDAYCRAEQLKQLRRAIEELPRRQREVAARRVLLHNSVGEVARDLGCADGTVKSTLHVAIARLQRALSARAR